MSKVDKQLANPKEPFLIVEERVCSELVVCAPHHAPKGVDVLPCGHVSDENVGYLARFLGQKLKVASVVVVNGTVDPNKSLETDYAKALCSFKPRVLIEIHGHGGERAQADVEISAGSKERERYAILLADALKDQIKGYPLLCDLTISAQWDQIYFKALHTATIKKDDWFGLHIELPAKLRLQKESNEPPSAGYLFCSVLAAVLRDLAGDFLP